MAEQLYYGPLWPLPTADSGAAITSALSGLIETSEYYEAAAKDLIISAPSTNTSDVYLVIAAADGTFSHLNDGTVVLTIPPGGSRNLAQAAYADNRYKLSNFGVDYDMDYYDTYYICAIMQ